MGFLLFTYTVSSRIDLLQNKIKMSEKFPLNVKIKEEKLTPERDDDTDPDDEIDRFLNSRPFGGEEDEKKDLEPAK